MVLLPTNLGAQVLTAHQLDSLGFALQADNANATVSWLERHYVPDSLWIDAHDLKAHALWAAGRTSAARREFRALLAQHVNFRRDLLLELAQLEADRADTTATFAYLHQCAQSYPLDWRPRYALGLLHAEQQRGDSARLYLEAALARCPLLPEAHFALGQVYLYQNRWVAAGFALWTSLLLDASGSNAPEATLLLEELAARYPDTYPQAKAAGLSFRPVLQATPPDALPQTDFPKDYTALPVLNAWLSAFSSQGQTSSDWPGAFYGGLFRALIAQELGTAALWWVYAAIGAPEATKWFEANPGEFATLTDEVHRYLTGPAATFQVPGFSVPIALTFDSLLNLTSAGTQRGETRMGHWETFYPNGERMETGAYDRVGVRHGPWTTYAPAGHPAFKVNYRYGTPEGPATEYYPNGNAKKTFAYRQGKLTGNLRWFYPWGFPKAQVFLENGRRNGTYVEFFPDSSLRTTARYTNGDLDGTLVNYYPHGQPQAVYRYAHGQPNGPYRGFYPNGTLQTEGFFEGGLRDGPWTFYSPDSQLVRVMTYQDEVLDGPMRTFHANGQLKAEFNYSQGELDGLSEEYDAKGNVLAQLYFNGGRFTRYRTFAPEGNLLTEFADPNGTLNYLRIRPEGTPQERGQYLTGLRLGTWKTFYANGARYEEVEHRRGVREGSYRRWTPDSTLVEKAQFLAGEYTGLRETFFPDGSPDSSCQYRNGQLNGLCQTHYPNGQVRTVEYYRSDSLVGQQQYFFVDGSPNYTHWVADTGQFFVLHRLGSRYFSDTLRVGGKCQWLQAHAHGGKSQVGELLGGWRTGKWVRFHATGDTALVEHYAHNQRHGAVRVYDGAGRLRTVQQYAYGELVSDSLIFPSYASQPSTSRDTTPSGTYPQPSQTRQFFDAEGKLVRVENYRNGVPHGDWRFYDVRGRLRLLERYQAGYRHGWADEYDAMGSPSRRLRYFHNVLVQVEDGSP